MVLQTTKTLQSSTRCDSTITIQIISNYQLPSVIFLQKQPSNKQYHEQQHSRTILLIQSQLWPSMSVDQVATSYWKDEGIFTGSSSEGRRDPEPHLVEHPAITTAEAYCIRGLLPPAGTQILINLSPRLPA